MVPFLANATMSVQYQLLLRITYTKISLKQLLPQGKIRWLLVAERWQMCFSWNCTVLTNLIEKFFKHNIGYYKYAKFNINDIKMPRINAKQHETDFHKSHYQLYLHIPSNNLINQSFQLPGLISDCVLPNMHPFFFKRLLYNSRYISAMKFTVFQKVHTLLNNTITKHYHVLWHVF